MNDEPYSLNHAHEWSVDPTEGPDAQSHAMGDALLPQEYAALEQRLTTDGVNWQRRLPPAEQVAERIRAIPWAAQDTASADTFVTPPDAAPSDAQSAPPGVMRQTISGERRSTRRGRILALVAAVVIVALLGAVFTQLARLSQQNGGQHSGTPIVSKPTATATSTPRPTATPASSTVTGTWQIVASPDTSGWLNGVAAVSPTDLWAVGYNNNRGGQTTTLVEHGDGSRWQVVSSPNPTPSQIGDALNAVAAISANDVWAVGTDGTNTLIEHWDGVTWAVIPSPSPSSAGNYLMGVTALASDNVWAAGYDITGQGCGQIPEPLIEHWNGTQWNVAATPPVANQYGARLYAIAADAANDVWVVGDVVERFDGSAWSLVDGSGQSGLFGVTALGSGNVWAVGANNAGPSIAHWDGRQLTTVASPKPTNLGQTTLLGITGVNADDIWAVGGNPPLGCSGVSFPLIEHWNGQSWGIVNGGDLGAGNDGLLDAVVAINTHDVWAVGEQYGPNTSQRSLIEHYTS